jgi:hypothetical protein
MRSKQREALKLETELRQLNTLVRERREQLARLQDCPNESCPCRAVWREQVEANLADQVGKIRQTVHTCSDNGLGTCQSQEAKPGSAAKVKDTAPRPAAKKGARAPSKAGKRRSPARP